MLDLDSSLGPGRAHLDVPAAPGGPVGRLLLGHGAGGGVQAPDLLLARDAAVAAGWAVARVEQPWRVAGRRVAPRPAALDAAWMDMVPALLRPGTGPLAGTTPVVQGGRSAGARVACRTRAALAARGVPCVAVLCLAFPLRYPGRPQPDRSAELPVDVPVLVVQGERDPFGGPPDVRSLAPANVQVVPVAGDHSLRSDRACLRAAVTGFLRALVPAPAPSSGALANMCESEGEQP